MITKVISATPFMGRMDCHLPFGVYRGVWGGHQVHITVVRRLDYELRTEEGIKTLAAPCEVIVTSTGITVRTLEKEC